MIQRVSRAEVSVDGETVGRIGRGILVLIGVEDGDGEKATAAMARKICEIRIFPDDSGKMNRSVAEVGGSVLLVSQFTLLGDTSRGRRPSFVRAADPGDAEFSIRKLADQIAGAGIPVQKGRFGAHMQVSLTNDGPVTLVLETG